MGLKHYLIKSVNKYLATQAAYGSMMSVCWSVHYIILVPLRMNGEPLTFSLAPQSGYIY